MAYEQETKYYVRDLKAVEARIQGLGGRLVHGRTHEYNLRFDLPDGSMVEAGQMLRLRRNDSKITITYKGPFEQVAAGVNRRREIEFNADEFEAAEELFRALGYQVSFVYEKFRTTYQMSTVQIMLDEMPIGSFVELEATSFESIRAVADVLNLDPAQHIEANYNDLFLRVVANIPLYVRDMTFAVFNGVEVLPTHLQVTPADE